MRVHWYVFSIVYRSIIVALSQVRKKMHFRLTQILGSIDLYFTANQNEGGWGKYLSEFRYGCASIAKSDTNPEVVVGPEVIKNQSLEVDEEVPVLHRTDEVGGQETLRVDEHVTLISREVRHVFVSSIAHVRNGLKTIEQIE